MKFGSVKIYEKYLDDLSKTMNPQKAIDMDYWVKNYIRFLKNDGSKLKYRYDRGSIVSVDLGTGIGREHSGLHFCVVLNNNYYYSSKLITVVPLSSINNPTKPLHNSNVFLGNELKELLKDKIDRVLKETLDAKAHMDEVINILWRLTRASSDLDKEKLISFSKFIAEDRNEATLKSILDSSIDISFIDDIKEKVSIIDEFKSCDFIELYNVMRIGKLSDSISKSEKVIFQKLDYIDKLVESLKEQQLKISKMKNSSKALAEQVTTISAIRVKDPISKYCPFASIKLSDESLDKIDKKIKELIFKD